MNLQNELITIQNNEQETKTKKMGILVSRRKSQIFIWPLA